MATERISFEDRKALLLAQGELDRLRIAVSCRALRDTIAPHNDDCREAKKSIVGAGLQLLLAVLGVTRTQRLQRSVTWGLMAWRLWRNWSKSR